MLNATQSPGCRQPWPGSGAARGISYSGEIGSSRDPKRKGCSDRHWPKLYKHTDWPQSASWPRCIRTISACFSNPVACRYTCHKPLAQPAAVPQEHKTVPRTDCDHLIDLSCHPALTAMDPVPCYPPPSRTTAATASMPKALPLPRPSQPAAMQHPCAHRTQLLRF